MRNLFSAESPIPPMILPLAAMLIAWAATREPANAAEAHTFVITAEDGYGVSECVAAHKECGRIVANTWCEGHGLGAATAYGSADDVTGSIGAIPASAAPPRGSVIITCGN